VLAIRNPLSTTNVLVPDPLQAEHLVRLIPCFRPVPVQDEQSTTGVTSTVFLVPLHASMKEIPMVASRSDPFALWERVRVPPAKPLPNSCSKRFAWEPSEASKNGLNPPPPNPAKPPPKGFRPNASGSNPGCCEVDPYWSYAVRFLSSLRIYHWGCASLSRTKRRLWIDRDTYFVGFLDLLKFLPCVFVWICIRVKFASELSGASETSACDKPNN
jgi:hypothetical protein